VYNFACFWLFCLPAEQAKGSTPCKLFLNNIKALVTNCARALSWNFCCHGLYRHLERTLISAITSTALPSTSRALTSASS